VRFVLLIFHLLVLLPSFGKGILCLTFDDRNFDSWTNAIPVFREYNAHATFFPYGQLDEHEVACCKILSDEGHTIGSHTVGHVDVTAATKHWWNRLLFYRRQIEPQVVSLQSQGIAIQSFAYPCSKCSAETDRFLGQWFSHLRGGAHYGYTTNGVSIIQLNDLFCPASQVNSQLCLLGVGVGDFYKTDISDLKKGILRAAQNDEILVLYSHAIVSDEVSDSGVDIRLSELTALLRTAKENNLALKGFNEL